VCEHPDDRPFKHRRSVSIHSPHVNFPGMAPKSPLFEALQPQPRDLNDSRIRHLCGYYSFCFAISTTAPTSGAALVFPWASRLNSTARPISPPVSRRAFFTPFQVPPSVRNDVHPFLHLISVRQFFLEALFKDSPFARDWRVTIPPKTEPL